MLSYFTGDPRPTIDDTTNDLLRKIALGLYRGGIGQAVAATSTNETTNGQIAGARSIQFLISPDFVGTINGLSFFGDRDSEWGLEDTGSLYGAVPYTITTGSLRITVTR